jgi:hypothetical protein
MTEVRQNDHPTGKNAFDLQPGNAVLSAVVEIATVPVEA